MEKTFKVFSSHGELTVDIETEKVLDCHLYAGSEYIDQIVRLNLEEQQHYRGKKIEAGNEFDILDFGTWQKDGSYEEPCHTWRADMIELQESEIVGTDAHKRLFKEMLQRAFTKRTGLEPNDYDLDDKFDHYYYQHTKHDMSENDIVMEYIEKYDLVDMGKKNWG